MEKMAGKSSDDPCSVSDGRDSRNSSSGAIKKKDTVTGKKISESKSKRKSNSMKQKTQEPFARETKGNNVTQRLFRRSSEEHKPCKRTEALSNTYDEKSWPCLPAPGQVARQPKTEKLPKKKPNAISESHNLTPNLRPKKPFMDQPPPRSEYPKSLPNTPISRKPSEKSKKKLKSPQKKFEPYIPLFEVQQGLKRGEFIEGALRINPRNYEDAYVSAPDGQMDIYIGGFRDRNRALNGDSVVVQVNPKQEWRVLCDAIKDYEDKHGQSVVEAVYSPVTSPCKIHTPEKFSRVQSRASSLWNATATERRPDSLEILGVDKIAEQLGAISIQTKKKSNRSKRRLMKQTSKSTSSNEDARLDSGSQKSRSTSYSHGSSEDYLGKMSSEDSPERKSETFLSPKQGMEKNSHKIMANGVTSQNSINGYFIEKGSEVPVSTFDDSKNNQQNFEHPTSKNFQENHDPWDPKEMSLSLFTSPHDLLDFGEGNIVQKYCDLYDKAEDGTENLSDSSSSLAGGIVVAPHDLSGDEFTDSVSSTSSHLGQIEQVIEDTDFFTCQQDAENNNCNTFENSENVRNRMDTINEAVLDMVVTTSRTSVLNEKTTEVASCKMEQKVSEVGYSAVGVLSDSVCSAEILVQETECHIEHTQPNVSKIDIGVYHSMPVQVINDNTQIGFFPENLNDSIELSKKKKRRPRKKKEVKILKNQSSGISENANKDDFFADNENSSNSVVNNSSTSSLKELSLESASYDIEKKGVDVISSIVMSSDSTSSVKNLEEKHKNIELLLQHPDKIDCTTFPSATTQKASEIIENNPCPQNLNISATPHKKRNRKPKHNKKIVNDVDSTVSKSINTASLTVEDIMKHPLWPKFVQKTGKVVHILEKKHSRIASGYLKLLQDRNPNFALFSPRDSRVPRLMIPMSDCPRDFYTRSHDFNNYLFLAHIEDWKEDGTFASGRLLRNLGKTGDIDPETESILLEYNVDDSEFSANVISCLPRNQDFVISDRELQKRKDLRKHCIFTIDPPTARDMDDAVSCELKENGNFLVGVHIADVTYFVKEGSALDQVAQSRATSVYLVQKVVPMLPRILCDNLCSLTPGQDRLTFSVLWEMTPEGEIISHWFDRSIINSCIKMSYDHAQDMIENPYKKWESDELPQIYGSFAVSDIVSRVSQLHKLALVLRKNRFFDGALRLDQVKLQFTLNHETGLPLGFSVYQQKDSNRLIEEFMLLANMTVAEKIYESYPEFAVLRRHPPPQMRTLEEVVSMCASVGIHLDASSSGSLQASISRYTGDDELSQARSLVLAHLCSKPMNCALYFCSGVLKDVSMFHHYALSVPFYTHFTSPIRRYPDILVHRLLGAALGHNALPEFDPKELQTIATHCNDAKYNAKRVSELSDEIFLAAFIKECGPIDAKAMVLGVLDHSFDCLVLHFGIVKRVYCDKLPLLSKKFQKVQGIPSLTLVWDVPEFQKGLSQNIIIFSLVDVSLSTGPGNALQVVTSLKCCQERLCPC